MKTVQELMEEMIKMKSIGQELKANFDGDADNVNGICGSAPNVNSLSKAF